MKMRYPFLATLGLVLLVSAPDARAEVSARTDRQGNYVMTHVLPSGPSSNAQIWASRRGRAIARKFVPLNPDGDANGDLWPTVAESPSAPYHPWVLWSRADGDNHRLAWSHWNQGAWSPIQWVDFKQQPVDQLDPSVAFNEDGRPLAVWWSRGEAGRGRIWVSVFLMTRWMEPFAVSDPLVDAQRPGIHVTPQGYINVDFDTPEGRVSQLVMFVEPVTITDDIHPQGRIWLKGLPLPMQEH